LCLGTKVLWSPDYPWIPKFLIPPENVKHNPNNQKPIIPTINTMSRTGEIQQRKPEIQEEFPIVPIYSPHRTTSHTQNVLDPPHFIIEPKANTS